MPIPPATPPSRTSQSRHRALKPPALLSLLALLASAPAFADIYNSLTNEVIPGTQGITPGPNVNLSGWNSPGHELEYASLYAVNLTNATFANSDLTNAYLSGAILAGTDFTNAFIAGADFSYTTRKGFLNTQLYSTYSYSHGNLIGIALGGNDLTHWIFANQHLANANFFGATLTNASFSYADLTSAYLSSSTLSSTNFSGAIVTGADFSYTTATGFIANQLYSTASYINQNLAGIVLESNTMTGWSFANQNLTNGDLSSSSLKGADFTNANLANARLSSSDFTNANFTHAALANADLSFSTFANATFSNADLTNAYLASATFTNATFANATLTNADLSSTDLTSAILSSTNFTNADFTFANLTSANFTNANLQNARFTSATTANADFTAADLRGAVDWAPDPTAITRNTILPDGTVPALTLNPGEIMRAGPTSPNSTLPIIRIAALSIAGATTGGAIAPTATLDLLNNSAIISAGYTPDELRQLLLAGAAPSHLGITSSAATATTGLGYLLGGDYALLHNTTVFAGVTVANTDLILKFTYFGDANLDGLITLQDYQLTDAGYLAGFDGSPGHTASWLDGDFNYDGIVNYLDYALLDASAGNTTPLGEQMIALHTAAFGAPYVQALNTDLGAPIPEPATLALLTLAAAVLPRRRKLRA